MSLRNAAPPAVVALDHPAVGAARRALEAGFGRPAVTQRHGGSTIPAVPLLATILGAPTLIVGFGLPEANAHGPNEWLSLDAFRRGRLALVQLWQELATSLPAERPSVSRD